MIGFLKYRGEPGIVFLYDCGSTRDDVECPKSSIDEGNLNRIDQEFLVGSKTIRKDRPKNMMLWNLLQCSSWRMMVMTKSSNAEPRKQLTETSSSAKGLIRLE